MSGKMMAAFGGIVLMAVAGLDYASASNARLPNDPLSVTAHVLNRFAQAKVATGFSAPAAPTSAEGQLAAANVAADAGVLAAMAETEIDAAASTIEGKVPDPKARTKKGEITVGIGTCAKSGAGKFCSVGD